MSAADSSKGDIVASTDFQDLPEERRAVVARLRREIAEGTYETPGRLEAALDAFLDQSEGNGSGPADKGHVKSPLRSNGLIAKSPLRSNGLNAKGPWRPDLFR